MTKLKTRLDQAEGRLEGSVFRRTVLVHLPEPVAKFWSPQLDLQVEELPTGGSRVCACFSPHPQLWTGFIAAQALLAFLAIGAGVYGTSLCMLGQSSVIAFGAMGAFLVGGGLVYGGAYIGQGLGSDEMYELRAFVEDALDEHEGDEPLPRPSSEVLIPYALAQPAEVQPRS